MEFDLIETPPTGAFENMQKDRELLDSLDPEGKPILHLYDWKAPSLTYGYFTKIEKYLDREALYREGISSARRVTGGGITLHFCDFAFSFFLPAKHPLFSVNTMKNYARVNGLVRRALFSLLPEKMTFYEDDSDPGDPSAASFFCMAKPTKYDVMIGGKKAGGAAQRRTERGLLHHGTIAVALPDRALLEKILLPETKIADLFYYRSHFFVGNHLDLEGVRAYRKEIRKALIDAIEKSEFGQNSGMILS